MWFGLLLACLFSAPADAATHGRAGNQLSKRTQLRYQDVLTTRTGSRWRGKIIERGEVFRIRLDDGSEVAVPKAEVVSVTRELHPGYPHRGQWETRVSAGFEIAFMSATQNAGLQSGPLAELALGKNFGGSFEPELVAIVSPFGPDEDSVTPQAGVGFRYYITPYKRGKPYTSTEVFFLGTRGDLGLRTGPGYVFDVTPNLGIAFQQGVTLISEHVDGQYDAAGVGFHFLLMGQGRF